MSNPATEYIRSLTPKERTAYFKEYERQRSRWPYHMEPLPLPTDLPPEQQLIVGQWRSRFYLATAWNRNNQLTLSVNRTQMDDTGEWKAGITLEDLHEIKNQCGYGTMIGVLAIPPTGEIFTNNTYVMYLNVATPRH